jgi:hypothetical protein
MVRVPALARLAARMFQRLPLTSGLRRKFLGRAVRRGYAATSRGDYEVAWLVYDPNVEIHMRESAAVSADLVGVYRGYDGWHRLIGELLDVWEFAWYPEEVLDCGQRAMITLRIETQGRGSGIPLTPPDVRRHHVGSRRARDSPGDLRRQSSGPRSRGAVGVAELEASGCPRYARARRVVRRSWSPARPKSCASGRPGDPLCSVGRPVRHGEMRSLHSEERSNLSLHLIAVPWVVRSRCALTPGSRHTSSSGE